MLKQNLCQFAVWIFHLIKFWNYSKCFSTQDNWNTFIDPMQQLTEKDQMISEGSLFIFWESVLVRHLANCNTLYVLELSQWGEQEQSVLLCLHFLVSGQMPSRDVPRQFLLKLRWATCIQQWMIFCFRNCETREKEPYLIISSLVWEDSPSRSS